MSSVPGTAVFLVSAATIEPVATASDSRAMANSFMAQPIVFSRRRNGGSSPFIFHQKLHDFSLAERNRHRLRPAQAWDKLYMKPIGRGPSTFGVPASAL